MNLPDAHVIGLRVGDPDAAHLVGVYQGDSCVIVTLRAGPGVLTRAALDTLRNIIIELFIIIISLLTHPVLIVGGLAHVEGLGVGEDAGVVLGVSLALDVDHLTLPRGCQGVTGS